MSKSTRSLELGVDQLRRSVDPNDLPFDTTDEVAPLVGTTGQDRAVNAIEFGLEIRTNGYNIYAAGATGTGKNTTVKTYLKKYAALEPVPDDWCYVYNFSDPYRPEAINLPAGEGSSLAKDMDELVEACKREIPRAFESENYEQRKGQVLKDLQARREELSNELQEHAQKQGLAIEATPIGIVTVPVLQGKPLSREEFEALPEDVKKVIKERSDQLQEEIRQALAKSRKIEKEATEKVRDLDKEVALFAVGHLLDDLKERYQQFTEVEEYLGKVQEDIIENIDAFRGGEKETVAIPGLDHVPVDGKFDRYRVNVLVNNALTPGAPVVIENHPTYYNLIGRIDYRARLGAITTDFNMIKPGALHRANGGYLVLQARDLLTSVLSWDTLKRALRSREIRIENIGEQYSAFPSASLKPEPVPLNVKVIMVGSSYIYHILYSLDEDFRKLFKVKADFDTEMYRTDEHVQKYAAFVSAQVREMGLKPFDRTAVAKIVEYGSRLLENQDRLSTKFLEVADIVNEAAFWASKDNAQQVTAKHVQEAIDQKVYRSNLVEEKIQDLIAEGTLIMDIEGMADAQVNGLSVLNVGDYYFGRPVKITARTFLGSGGVVNIERETKMSGPIHTKGFLILTHYLAGKYGQDKPLVLSGSITFEQQYDEVEGDSASSTELYALISSLSGLSLNQSIAVTGSVNQKGEIQPVGGVTRKIEGFFDVCKIKGLTGQQGVLIPSRNVDNLMLKEEVVEAVREGRFHIWAIDTIEEGIELLTGVPAGEMKADGTYPKGTVSYLVDAKLREFAEKAKEYGRAGTRNGQRMLNGEKAA
ncbi:MAG: AAA family ATPase [Chloroflexi bacterium]|nr:AAA family ATPase [Chloroflexota bacterium]